MSENSEQEQGFEQQLERLEDLVRDLESGDLGLEEGVERYREGVALLKTLNTSLGAAEQKVEALTETLRQELAELEQADEPESGDA